MREFCHADIGKTEAVSRVFSPVYNTTFPSMIDYFGFWYRIALNPFEKRRVNDCQKV